MSLAKRDIGGEDILTNIYDYQTAMLSHEIAKVHKGVFGKGPSDIIITIRQGLIAVKAEGVLTQLEKNLLETAEGEKTVTTVRQLLSDKFKQNLVKDIKSILGSDSLEVMTELFVDSDQMVMIFC